MNRIFSIIPILVAIVPAVWIVWLFLTRHEGEPGGELQINVDFVGQQNAKWLIEVSAILTNRSLVRHRYRDFQVKIRYLLPYDEIVDGEKKIEYQLECLRNINERIGGETRVFANAAYIDPRLSFRHSYITFVPAEATFVWVQCELLFPSWYQWLRWKKKKLKAKDKKRLKKKNSQRLFKVPKETSSL